MLNDLKIYALTWNTNSRSPPDDLNEALGFNRDFYSKSELPDIYAIGLQEVSVNPLNVILEEPWITAIHGSLNRWDYVKIKETRLQGILLVVFTKREHLTSIRRVKTSYTRTGLGGLWGNKGAVSVRFDYKGTSVCVINSHLAAHDGEIEQRVKEYNTIINKQVFIDVPTPNIMSHDYVLWMGDLNFRIDNLEINEVVDKISNFNNWNQLYETVFVHDQLTKARNSGRAFSEFEETTPKFLPTYKFKVNTDEYDTRRKPAWTDRILHRFISNAYGRVQLNLQQLEYTSHRKYKISDHKPVSALYSIKTFDAALSRELKGIEPFEINFLPITDWHSNKESAVYYTTDSSKIRTKRDLRDESDTRRLKESITSWDWVALYRDGFASLDDPVAYVWADTTPIPNPPANMQRSIRSSSQIDTDAADSSVANETFTADSSVTTPVFSVTFSEQAVASPNVYRLLYFNANGDVMGMSTPFEIAG